MSKKNIWYKNGKRRDIPSPWYVNWLRNESAEIIQNYVDRLLTIIEQSRENHKIDWRKEGF